MNGPDEPAGEELQQLFPGESEMAHRMRELNWAATLLGAPEGWAEPLKHSVKLCLTSLAPIVLFWGRELAMLYNDSFIEFLGSAKHPIGLGCPGREPWSDIWATMEPMFQEVRSTGRAKRLQDVPLFLARNLPKEEVYLTFTIGPIFSNSGRVDGFFCPCTEDTERVVGARRLETLRELGVQVLEGRSVDDACEEAAKVLARAKRTEDALRESEQRFRNMADHAPVIIWMTQPDGLCTYLSQTWYEFTGQSQDEGLGMGWIEVVHPDDRQHTRETFLTANLRHESFRLDYRLRRNDGEYRWAIDSAAPRYGPQGAFLGYIGSVIDITERKQAEDKLQRAHGELEQRVRQRTEQLTEVKNELAAELSAMQSLHALGTRLSSNAELQPLLEAVLDATMALQHADFGDVQLYDPQTTLLELVAQRGFSPEFLNDFRRVYEGTAACDPSLLRRERVLVEDVLTDSGFRPHLQMAASGGFRALQRIPLFSHSGEPLGMISTYFRQPRRPSELELRATDLYAQQAAELIDRKQAEEKLRRSEAHLVQGQRLSKTGSCVWTPSTGDLLLSREYCRMFGVNPDQPRTSYSRFLENLHPADRGLADRIMTRAGRENRGFELDYRIVLPEGSIKHIHAIGQPLPKPPDGPPEFISTVMDVTERFDTEASLRESEARFRSYFELGLIGMARTSFTKEILEVNDELCRILGYHRQELLRKSWTEITHPEDLPADAAQFDRVVAGEIDGYTLEKRWIRKDGRPIDSIVAVKCLRRLDGGVDYFVKLVLDTTERKRAEERLQNSQLELAHVTRLSTMGELVASIAHEINQPLGAIINNGNACARLLDRGTSPGEIRSIVSDMVSDANRASTIIERIRALTKKSVPERKVLFIEEIIDDVLALSRRALLEREIKVQATAAQHLPRIVGDRVQLQQVLLNLVMNAVDAMSNVSDERRELIIDVTPAQLAARPALLITVKDFGRGFPPQAAEKLFEAFYTTKPDGMGMGLRISKSIVESHGGQLWAALNAGPGATFSCVLPAEQCPEQAAPPG